MAVSYMLELTLEELEMVRFLLALAKSYPGPKNPKSAGVHFDAALDTALSKVHRLMEGQ